MCREQDVALTLPASTPAAQAAASAAAANGAAVSTDAEGGKGGEVAEGLEVLGVDNPSSQPH